MHRSSYSFQDGLKQHFLGRGVRPDLTVDVVDKSPKVMRSENSSRRRGKSTIGNIFIQEVKPAPNQDSPSTVDAIEKLPETPVMLSNHGRARKALRPSNFWSESGVDSESTSKDCGRSEEPSHDEETETVGVATDQSPSQSHRLKQYCSPRVPKRSSNPDLPPVDMEPFQVVTTPRSRGDAAAIAIHIPTPPPSINRQATFEVTPRISRTVIPARCRRNNLASEESMTPEKSYTIVGSGSGGGAAHDAAASGSAKAAKAARNDTKLRNILNSTLPVPRSPRLSSFGSDRGGGPAITEFPLWKKKGLGNDVRMQNHKAPSNLASALSIKTPTIPTLGGSKAPVRSISLPAGLSINSKIPSDQSLGNHSRPFSGEQSGRPPPSSSRPLNPYATRTSPHPQKHENVFSFSNMGESRSDGMFTAPPRTIPTSFFGLSSSEEVFNKKPLEQKNVLTAPSGGGVSSKNSLDVIISTDGGNFQSQEFVSPLRPGRTISSNDEPLSLNIGDSSWLTFLNKHQAMQDGLDSSSSPRPGYHHHKSKSDGVAVASSPISQSWMDTDSPKTWKTKSCFHIDRTGLYPEESKASFASPINSLPTMPGYNQANPSSNKNETFGVHSETIAENHRKVFSNNTTGFREKPNERQRTSAVHRRVSSDLASKFQEVTKPPTVTPEHRNTGSLSIISEYLNCGSRHIPLSTPHFPSPGYTDRGVSDFGVSGRPPVSSLEEEEVVTMHWKRGELLGEGRFGKVFVGLNGETGVLFAVKEIALVDGTDDEVAVLQSEINTMKHLSHPNIVSYVGMECTDYTMFIFLEYVVGGSIASMLQQFGVFKEDLIRRFTQQIIQGVQYLHSYRIIHRDIKGGNVLVTEQGVAKLADFGCSKQLQGMHTQNAEDSSHAIRGSVPWMAPEVIKQTGHGRSADIWSVGATVIEMASASHPWPAFSNNLAALFHVATSSDPPPIPEELSDDAKDFLYCCLCINPEDRWKADELSCHVFLTEDRKGCGTWDATTS